MASGSSGASHGASRAPTRTTAASVRPSTAVLRRQSWGQKWPVGCEVADTAMPATPGTATGSTTDTGVEGGMKEIHHQVHGDEDGGEEERGARDDREVALLDGLEQQPADAGQDEDLLGEHEAADQHAHLDARDIEHGDERIGEHVSVHHAPLRQALRPGGAVIVETQVLL